MLWSDGEGGTFFGTECVSVYADRKYLIFLLGKHSDNTHAENRKSSSLHSKTIRQWLLVWRSLFRLFLSLSFIWFARFFCIFMCAESRGINVSGWPRPRVLSVTKSYCVEILSYLTFYWLSLNVRWMCFLLYFRFAYGVDGEVIFLSAFTKRHFNGDIRDVVWWMLSSSVQVIDKLWLELLRLLEL